MNTPLTDYGSKVRQRRQEMRITQSDLAKQVGIAENSLRRIEQGDRNPRKPTLDALCRELKLDPGTLESIHLQQLRINKQEILDDINKSARKAMEYYDAVLTKLDSIDENYSPKHDNTEAHGSTIANLWSEYHRVSESENWEQLTEPYLRERPKLVAAMEYRKLSALKNQIIMLRYTTEHTLDDWNSIHGDSDSD